MRGRKWGWQGGRREGALNRVWARRTWVLDI